MWIKASSDHNSQRRGKNLTLLNLLPFVIIVVMGGMNMTKQHAAVLPSGITSGKIPTFCRLGKEAKKGSIA